MNWFLTLIRNDCWLQICYGIGTYEKNFGLTFHLTINQMYGAYHLYSSKNADQSEFLNVYLNLIWSKKILSHGFLTV